jgi:hypothetical protein
MAIDPQYFENSCTYEMLSPTRFKIWLPVLKLCVRYNMATP